jgi:hypothetical protein
MMFATMSLNRSLICLKLSIAKIDKHQRIKTIGPRFKPVLVLNILIPKLSSFGEKSQNNSPKTMAMKKAIINAKISLLIDVFILVDTCHITGCGLA